MINSPVGVAYVVKCEANAWDDDALEHLFCSDCKSTNERRRRVLQLVIAVPVSERLQPTQRFGRKTEGTHALWR